VLELSPEAFASVWKTGFTDKHEDTVKGIWQNMVLVAVSS
jgi:hypothetical protein